MATTEACDTTIRVKKTTKYYLMIVVNAQHETAAVPTYLRMYEHKKALHEAFQTDCR